MKQGQQVTGFETVEHEADLCIVGGGLAGFAAALTAARRGIRVFLMHDRPVLGGQRIQRDTYVHPGSAETQ